MNKQKLFEKYQSILANYNNLFEKSRIFTNISLISFSDFPTNLSDYFKIKLIEFNSTKKEISESEYKKIYEEYISRNEFFEEYLKDNHPDLADIEPTLFTENELIINLLKLFRSRVNEDNEIDLNNLDDMLRSNYKYLILSSELVLNHVYFDSFLNESLRIIYQMKSEFLKTKEKSIDYEIYSYGKKPLIKRIDFLRELGVDIQLTKNEKDVLLESRGLRNVVVHSNGKIDTEFMKWVKNTDYNLDDNINLTNVYLKKVSDLMLDIINSIFSSINQRFFK